MAGKEKKNTKNKIDVIFSIPLFILVFNINIKKFQKFFKNFITIKYYSIYIFL